MNIFYLDHNIKKCAEYHYDKHLIKMQLETAQLLSTALHLNGLSDLAPYKKTHINHPSTKWVTDSYGNFKWLCELGIALYDEYKFRYGENKIHKSGELIKQIYKTTPKFNDKEFYEPPSVMPDEFKITNDSIINYRNYYINGKLHLMNYKKRDVPYWINK